VTKALDAWALLALVRDEPPAERVEAELAGGTGVISWINLGEVYYHELRRLGEDGAGRLVERARRVLIAEEPDADLVMDAARIKAAGKLSYADCFALATAARHTIPLLTGDPEILEAATGVEVVDLR
jgi:predicted nucleic acid-binding protein